MSNSKTGHSAEKTGHSTGHEAGHSRARTPYSVGMSRLSHGTQRRDIGTRDTGHSVEEIGTDRASEHGTCPQGPPGTDTSHVPQSGQGRAKTAASWIHLAAMNTIADHDAGLIVDAGKLQRARVVVESLS